MKTLPFIKMHGLGNDYVYIDCFQPETADMIGQLDIHALAQRISERHTGIGSDGLVLIMPSRVADIKMRMFNADGSEAEMCGNAARCIGKYAYEKGYCNQDMKLETMAGIKHIHVDTESGKVSHITVEIGKTTGNPHRVFFVDKEEDIDALFEQLCTDSRYAELRATTNIECAYVIDRNALRMRVCERGTGETMACGTGACAAAVAAMEQTKTAYQVSVYMPGGKVEVRRDEEGNIYLSGSATTIYSGIYYLEEGLCK